MRRLLILPIVHSRSDLGSLQNAARGAKVAALGEQREQAVAESIQAFWEQVRLTLISMDLEFPRTLIYQDGLPKVDNVALQIEKQIVDDLAGAGSANHQIVQWMMQQGAALVGTESPELLVQEYQAIRRVLAEGFRSDARESTVDAQPSLLEQRDRFIADRIAATLGQQQQGVLFIGMLHQVERYLPDDLPLEYPVGRPIQGHSRLLDHHLVRSQEN